ncbi:transcription initiation factor TFIID subunit 9-like [Silurus meridionalis]|uniref:transcription initiation factor TFIID subunit 9-like n=1 Tax=Silurus meridionalis TaxID=175797 RepID=UPI001EEC72DC|nr:transcription initiation factor TFIID subunit 9-like [Silurus meridionalis]
MTIIEDAEIYATHAKKANTDADDIQLAIQSGMDQSFTFPPSQDSWRLLGIRIPLPLIKPYAGPNLPPDYCLTAPNYKFKSLQKKSSAGRNIVLCFSVGAVASRPSTPTLAILSVQTMGSKVGMPVSLKGQHFTVQITSSQATSTKPATPTTPGMVQNVLINLSLISSKNILITNNMVSQNLSGHSG